MRIYAPTLEHPILMDDDLPAWADGYRAVRQLDDNDHWLVLMPLLLGRARIALATPISLGEHWCYDDPAFATFEFLCWPDPPETWHRHSYWNEHGHWVEEHR